MSDRQHIDIQPMSAAAFTLKAGRHCTIADVTGGQPGDLVVMSSADFRVRHNAARSRVENATCRPTVGHALWSGGAHPEPLLAITADSAPAHDLLYPPCCRYALNKRFGVDRDGCMEHLARALAPYDVTPHDLPDPLNLFFRVDVANDGAIALGEHPRHAGQSITLCAQVDCLLAVSTCSVPIAGRGNSGYRVTIDG